MNIVVLAGGLSPERDVSLSSGAKIAAALRARGHRVCLLDLFFGVARVPDDPLSLFTQEQPPVEAAIGEAAPDLAAVRAARGAGLSGSIGGGVIELCRAADVTFLALHGAEGENGKLQACLDLYGVPYTGSGYLGSALAMDKELSKILFRSSGIPTPPGVTLRRGDAVPESIGFPCVVKPCSGGSSVGTSIVTEPEKLPGALEEAFSCDEAVLVEKYIRARELTVGVMDGRAMAVIEIIPKTGFYDYKNKYQAGLTEEICPAPISAKDTERVQRLAERVYEALHLDAYGRVDFLMDKADGELYCLEANTLPGMTPTSLIPQMAAAEGMDYGELCEKIIEVSLKKYKK